MSHQSHLIKQNIHSYLQQHEHKSLLRLLTCGSVDDGKSTLIGRLLHDSKLVYEDQLAAVKQASLSGQGNQDSGQLDLALLVDGLQAEREQGITIDVAYRYFSTSKRKFIIADTPGHEQYTRNMATGASNCDLAIILVDARKGLLTQTRRHSFIVSLLGIKHIVVAVNKMDLMDYNQNVFEQIQQDYQTFAQNLDLPNIHFIPVSALTGDNVVDESPQMPWYQGPSLLHLLEDLNTQTDVSQGDWQLPVQYVNRPNANFRGYCGTIAAGSVKPGDEVRVLPSGQTSTIASIVTADGDLKQAFAPMAITVTLTHEIDISRGDTLVHANNATHTVSSQQITANLVWMDQQTLNLSRDYELKLGSKRINARVKKINYKVNVNTLERSSANTLELNEIGLVELHLDAPIPASEFKHSKGLGSFILIDKISHATAAAGMISELKVVSTTAANDNLATLNLPRANQQLDSASAEEVVKWALGLGGKTLVTTNFGPQEAVLLHMVNQVSADTQVLWIDSGYNMPQTYAYAEQVINQLNLNLVVYTPAVSAARRDAVMGGIPTTDEPAHVEFTEQFKLEPFKRAMAEIAPEVWLTALRREQSQLRQQMDTVAHGPSGTIKVSPLLDWSLEDMQAYLTKHGLPDETRYFDPTKAEAGRECGLHTLVGDTPKKVN
ncbi:sulfate adenylyltransferase subunit CysN [Candidatus Njordibacter sp. Uisw_039]|uniref:sulfate adenylyltransferase subunit CysN n=1 Tax=Candidatus Njordibacter sp. Uisw_039 TaxID=3230972 RepID=UPI003D57C34B